MVHLGKKKKIIFIVVKTKNGTCSFFAYATIYIIAKNKRLTIAIIAVKKSYTSVAIITYLLEKINSLNLKIKNNCI